LLYGFNELNLNDINKAISVIKKNNIKHVSWYALEIKENSMLARDKYVCNDDLIDEQLQLIISEMKKNGFNRYEVSNWSTNKRYESMHNKAYWLTKDWRAIGYGGCGL
jgi:oxygen-independent coproporphyrinogen-3 oxidase